MARADRQNDVEIEPLVAQIRAASPAARRAISRFVEFVLHEEDHSDAAAAMRLSEGAFARVWDNSDDAAYDEL